MTNADPVEYQLIGYSPRCDELDHDLFVPGPELVPPGTPPACVPCSLAWRRAFRAGEDPAAAVRDLRAG